MWYYRKIGGKFSVGFYDSFSVWNVDSEFPDRVNALSRVHYLNGGNESALNRIDHVLSDISQYIDQIRSNLDHRLNTK